MLTTADRGILLFMLATIGFVFFIFVLGWILAHEVMRTDGTVGQYQDFARRNRALAKRFRELGSEADAERCDREATACDTHAWYRSLPWYQAVWLALKYDD